MRFFTVWLESERVEGAEMAPTAYTVMAIRDDGHLLLANEPRNGLRWHAPDDCHLASFHRNESEEAWFHRQQHEAATEHGH